MKYRYKLGIGGIDVKMVALYQNLSFEPQTLDEITDKIHKCFKSEDREKIKNEIECLITDLIDDGIIEEIELQETKQQC